MKKIEKMVKNGKTNLTSSIPSKPYLSKPLHKFHEAGKN
jgi:hypothetical protein